MRNKLGINFLSIKLNSEIVKVLKNNNKINLSIGTIWFNKISNKSLIRYALLVTKSQFKNAVKRNKIKRQLRTILQKTNFNGGFEILIKPNKIYEKKSYLQINNLITTSISKYYGK